MSRSSLPPPSPRGGVCSSDGKCSFRIRFGPRRSFLRTHTQAATMLVAVPAKNPKANQAALVPADDWFSPLIPLSCDGGTTNGGGEGGGGGGGGGGDGDGEGARPGGNGGIAGDGGNAASNPLPQLARIW